jgi:hypothetical protein
MAQFKYYLLETPNTIRLVWQEPSNDPSQHGKVQLQLRHAELSEISKQYLALSYLWGNPAKVHTVSLNGADFGVTDNLMYFLWREQPQEPQLFWIDAICINQNDNVEKSGQIPRMREIYENAAVVHAELGPASEDEESVIPQMQHLNLCVRAEQRRVKSENNGVMIYDQMNLPFIESYEPKVWENIGKFFGRSWWRRAWVMQEATAIDDT